MNHSCKSDVPPRAGNAPGAGDIVSWAICEGYAPSAPWGTTPIGNLDSARDRKLVPIPIDDVLALFENGVNARLPDLKCMPTHDEIEQLFVMKSGRTLAQEAEIIFQLNNGGLIDAFVVCATGRHMYPEILAKLIDALFDDIAPAIFETKRKYNRIRSYQLFPELAPDFIGSEFFPMHPSFPSGHSTQAHFFAGLFEDVYDGLTGASQVAWQIGVNREIAGVHYRSDTIGGQILAGILLGSARKSTEYLKRIEEIKAQIGEGQQGKMSLPMVGPRR